MPYCLLVDGMMLNMARQVLSEQDANIKFNAACALVSSLQQLATAWRRVIGVKKDESPTTASEAVIREKGGGGRAADEADADGAAAPLHAVAGATVPDPKRGAAIEEMTAKTKRKASMISPCMDGGGPNAGGRRAKGASSAAVGWRPPILRASDRALLMEVVWSNLDENVWQTARTVSGRGVDMVSAWCGYGVSLPAIV